MSETNEVYEKRLLSLATFLEQLPPEKFDFATWVGKDYQGRPDLSCGTTACGLGWAAAMPEFQALGLCIREHPTRVANKRFFYPALADESLPVPSKDELIILPPVDAFRSTCRATAFLFGITTEETELLFVPTEDVRDDEGETGDNYLLDPDEEEGDDGRLSRRVSPKRLAQHIRSFCEYKFHDV